MYAQSNVLVHPSLLFLSKSAWFHGRKCGLRFSLLKQFPCDKYPAQDAHRSELSLHEGSHYCCLTTSKLRMRPRMLPNFMKISWVALNCYMRAYIKVYGIFRRLIPMWVQTIHTQTSSMHVSADREWASLCQKVPRLRPLILLIEPVWKRRL
jgi:hypothetical protein